MESRGNDGLWRMTLALVVGLSMVLAGSSVTAADQDPSQSPPSAGQQQQPPAAPEPSSPAQPPSQPQQQESIVAPAQVSDEEMENFVRSVAEVNKIQTSLKEKLPTLQDAAEAERVQQQSNAEMARIIQGCDLDVERYNELARSVSSSPELSQRFQAKQQELASRPNVRPCVSDQPGGDSR